MTRIQIYIGNDMTRDDEGELNYEDYIATLPRHKVIGPHSWKVGQRLEEGVDFKKGVGATIIEGYPTSPEVVIIPIEGEQEEIYHFTKDQLYQIVSALQYSRDSINEMSKQISRQNDLIVSLEAEIDQDQQTKEELRQQLIVFQDECNRLQSIGEHWQMKALYNDPDKSGWRPPKIDNL